MEKSKPYKQTVIPEVSTENWKNMPIKAFHEKVSNYYRMHYQGKCRIINQHLGIAVEFDRSGANKTSHGGHLYAKKACLLEVLDKVIRYAEYSNWGERKITDSPTVIGYLNFKVKVKIDGKIEHVHLIIRVTNNGKFHYSMEVNIWK
ncbi:MAG: hypothetical protein FWC94_07120 [Bacteroidales bacterium]|nr:hypothetical protein [Bacteroidales bacterium]